MSDETYTLDLAFDTDSAEFVRGFEAADVYRSAQRFANGEHPHNPEPGCDCGCEPGEFWETVHATNAEMMLRIGDRLGLRVQSEEVGDGWLHVRFSTGSKDT